MLALEVLISQVYRPNRGEKHMPSTRRLAKYRFEDRTKLKSIIEMLNSISVRKIDYSVICSQYSGYEETLIKEKTTIQIGVDIRDILNDLKLHPRETYQDVLIRILWERATQEK